MPSSSTFTVPASPAASEAAENSGTYEHNDDHAGEAVGHLIEFFRKPRNSALVEAIAVQVQEAEDAHLALRNAFGLDNATGHQLGLLGKLVGELPAGRSDAAYRAAIRVRILVNRSEGTLPELVAIAEGISPGTEIYTVEYGNAAISLEFSTLGSVSLQEAYALLRAAKTAGVRLMVGSGAGTNGAVDGAPAGGVMGAVDGDPAGFVMSGGT